MKTMNSITQKTLSSREFEILELIVKEYSTKEIAIQLYLGFETIKTYRKNLLRKLGAKNVVGLVKFAFLNDLIQIEKTAAQA